MALTLEQIHAPQDLSVKSSNEIKIYVHCHVASIPEQNVIDAWEILEYNK